MRNYNIVALLKIISIFAFVIVYNMERVKRHKVWAVWLLLAVFTLPFAVKSVHIYHTAEHSQHNCSDPSYEHHNCSDCPICQFALSSFTEAVVLGYDFRIILYGFVYVIPFQNNPYQQVLIPYGLRAPPVV